MFAQIQKRNRTFLLTCINFIDEVNILLCINLVLKNAVGYYIYIIQLSYFDRHRTAGKENGRLDGDHYDFEKVIIRIQQHCGCKT